MSGITGRNEIRRLIADFEEPIPAEVKKEIRALIRKRGNPILARIRANASWSSRIPAATRLSQSLTGKRAGIRFVVNARKAPHARPYEGLSGRVFRHPVYGNREVWRAERARPFFFREVEREGEELPKDIGDVIMQVARRHGFH